VLRRNLAPRWYVPRADIEKSALTAVEGQTFCPYKGLASCYDVAGAHRAAWSYQNAWTEVRRISGLVSFEPDKVAVYLDGIQLMLEPGQTVISHGIDRDLTVREIAGTPAATPSPEAHKSRAPAGAQADPAANRPRNQSIGHPATLGKTGRRSAQKEATCHHFCQ
jgi:Domain of unknown function (DUF427)